MRVPVEGQGRDPVAMLRAKGYPLVNQWTEHKLGTLEIDRYQVDPKRLWQLTTEDAIGSDIDLIIRDLETGQELGVDLSIYRPDTRLYKIRDYAKAAGRRARLIIR